MRVIVNAEDHGGRSTPYTKPDIGSALDIFFVGEDPDTFCDPDAEEQMTREDALATFEQQHEVRFFNSEGEQVTITRDWGDR
jgi:hypothetical protein